MDTKKNLQDLLCLADFRIFILKWDVTANRYIVPFIFAPAVKGWRDRTLFDILTQQRFVIETSSKSL